MHIDFALPVEGDLAAGFKEWQRKAQRSVMDYSFHMAVTTWNDKVGCMAPEAAFERFQRDFGAHTLSLPARWRMTWKC